MVSNNTQSANWINRAKMMIWLLSFNLLRKSCWTTTHFLFYWKEHKEESFYYFCRILSDSWLHWARQCCSTCSFLADVGQVVVAGHIVPLAILMGNGHHTVLPTCEEVIRLALPPVLIYLNHSKKTQKEFSYICFVLSQPSGNVFSLFYLVIFLLETKMNCGCSDYCHT